MPAVTIRFDMTKHDIRNGRNTGSPVSMVDMSPVQWLYMYNETYLGAASNPPPSLPAISPASWN